MVLVASFRPEGTDALSIMAVAIRPVSRQRRGWSSLDSVRGRETCWCEPTEPSGGDSSDADLATLRVLKVDVEPPTRIPSCRAGRRCATLACKCDARGERDFLYC